MKLYRFYLAVFVGIMAVASSAMAATSDSVLLAQLKTIDPNLLPYFPRWTICEPNLQVQIEQIFLLDGRPKSSLSKTSITVTSAPVKDPNDPQYNLLLLECGSEKMVASELESKLRKIYGLLIDPKRPYCHVDIPITVPPSIAQSEAILDYMDQPTDVTHSFSVSAFEQTLKIGNTNYWIRSGIGTDAVGYPFLSSGESRVLLQVPQYPNTDPSTNKAIPSLIRAHFGVGYRMGDTANGVLSFLPTRRLNAAYGGKAIFGLDFHAPFEPRFGLRFNIEAPMRGLDDNRNIDPQAYAGYNKTVRQGLRDTTLRILPILRTTGQATLFYNWWLDEARPENFFRVDLGVGYSEVQETALGLQQDGGGLPALRVNRVNGLQLHHPDQFLDWVYTRFEYRNQGNWPFGATLQYANQILYGRAYMHIFARWLYLEARWSRPLRDAMPFEETTFMVSPVLRLNI